MQRIPRQAMLAGILIAGCATSTSRPAVSPAQRAEPAQAGMESHQHGPALDATAGAGFTVADVRFMQHMIGHHAQAIEMAAMAPAGGASERVLQLAEKIDISQRDEIEFMKDWLAQRHQPVPDDAQARSMMMPGMLTAEELVLLGGARGREFDRLFLSFMIRHHEGALQMVDELLDRPGAAQDSDIFRFVTDVDADQRDEIYVMRTMLAALDNNGGSSDR